MANTYTRLIVHAVFSTKERKRFLVPPCQNSLYAYMGGILKNIGCKPIMINGTEDHVHALSYMPATLSIADFARLLKSNSSKWLNESGHSPMFQGWQTGYAAMSVDVASLGRVRSYIERQKEHHHVMTFREELVRTLQEEGIEYDERYLWD